MNIHIVHLPVLQSQASQIRMCVPQKAKWLTNDIKINCFWVLNPGQKVIAGILVLHAIQAKPSVHYKDSMTPSLIWGLKGWAAEPEAQWPDMSLRYANHRVTWSLLDHIWPWALPQTLIFSKDNTEKDTSWIILELWWLFFFFVLNV